VASRREFLAGSVLGVAGVQQLPGVPRNEQYVEPAVRRGIPASMQSVCRWPFGSVPLDEFCLMVKGLGFGAVDLVDRDDWAMVKSHGLAISTANSSPRRDFISKGLNDRGNHEVIVGELNEVIPAAASAGIPNVIAMFGNHAGASREDAIAACAEGLAHVAPTAEEHGVTVILEMLNSRVDHKGFQGDTTPFGVEVCERVGSPRVRLLYDIYHMQIMEGDVIRTIRDNHQWIAHYHTAGNPGRRDLDQSQELQYGAIAAAIAETGFEGWLAHEFYAKGEPAESLAAARDVVVG
jgi:hydroxypyruvate isomerase